MKKKILLFFLVLMSTVLTVSSQTITVRNVYVGGVLQPPGSPCYSWMTFNAYANPGEEVLLDFSSVPPGFVVDDILITERNSGTLHQVSFIRNGNCYFIMINDEDGVYVDVNYEVASSIPNSVDAMRYIRNGQVQPVSQAVPAGSLASVSANPDPGFGILAVTAEVFSGIFINGGVPYMTLLQPDPYDPYRFDFIKGNHPVNVMATFMSLYYPPRLLKVEHHQDIISTDVVINGYQSVPDNVNLQYDEYYVYAGDNITATDNPNLDYWTTMIWTSATAPGSVYYTELYNTNIINFIMPDCDVEIAREVTYGPYRIKITRSAMWNGTVTTLGDFYYADAGYTVYLVVTPDPGYELVPGSLTVTGVTPQIIPTQTPNFYFFTMPSANVYVHARFQKATYNLTVAPTPAGNDFTARDMTLNPTNYAHSDGGPYVIPAQYNDMIRIRATPDMTNYYSLHYYTVKRTSNNQVFGNVSPNHNLFTMSDFDLTLEPVFYSNPGTPPPIPNPLNPIFYSADNSYVMLHLLSKSKSSQDETPGWVQAIPGQPLCLTVTPNPGYQVKKDDITVKLVDVSQDAEIIVGTGDISGPDDYVTETTDYTFMYDLPADFDQYSVRLVIDVKSEPVVYDITVDPNILHGIVEVPATANADETVTLTVTPDPGYSLKGISVSPLAPGFFVDVENNQFTMPACNVFVSAQFQESEFDLGDVNGDGFISIADVTTLIDYLLSGDVSLINSDAADCHQDGNISIADVTALIDYLLSGSW